MDKKWRRKASIKPSIWQDNNRRWAVPQHYTCSYMAMFPPALPHYFIRRFTEKGDIVLDPFSGRGTTAVEAMAQGRIGIGNDLNDLAYVLTKGKIVNPDLDSVLSRLDDLESKYDKKDWFTFSGMPRKISMIYHPNTQRQLMYLKKELDWRHDDVDAFLSMVLMGAMHGQSSGFLSLEMPNTFSMGWNYVKKYIKTHDLNRPDRDVFKVLRDRCKRFLKLGQLPGKGKAFHTNSKVLGESGLIEHHSVKMIFSSPPYLKVIKYGLYNWIRLWWLVEDYKEIDKKLDDEHSIKPYLDFMKKILETTLPLLDPQKGIACWVIGDAHEYNLAEMVWNQVGKKISVKDSNGVEQRYRLLDIIEDKIDDEQKVTKLWKTETIQVVRVGPEGDVIEMIGESSVESEAEKMALEAEIDQNSTIQKRVELKNDKSGKATPVDRILIICPENSKPGVYLSNKGINWEPIDN